MHGLVGGAGAATALSVADSTDVPEVTTWDGMIDWLVESFTGQSVGLIIDLGPRDYVHVDDDHDSVDETVASGLWQRRTVPALKRRTRPVKICRRRPLTS